MNFPQNTIDSYVKLTNYPTAIYRITVNDQDISNQIESRLISLTIQDNRGMVADSVDIVLDDADNILEIPPVGAEIKVWIGWDATGLVYKGSYTVTGGSHSGAPDQLHIAAESTDLAESFRQKRERSFHNQTIKSIFEKIAMDYDLKVIVHEKFANHIVDHIDQNESDANIITRIADENDAMATVKNGTILLLPIGQSQTASGLNLPPVEIFRTDGDQHNYSYGKSNNKVDGVKAYYYDQQKGEKQYVIVGITTDNPKEVRFIHRDKKTAEFAANAELNRCKRAEQTFTYNFASGRADMIPEQEFTFVGLKSQIDDIVWLGKSITHNLSSDSGYTNSIELELKLPNADDIATLFEDKTKIESEKKSEIGNRKSKSLKDYTGVKTWYRGNPKSVLITVGDQTKPYVIYYTYKSKKTAETAINKMMARINNAK